MAIIDEVVTRIPQWNNKQVVVTSLCGGLTNSNLRVDVDGVPYFVRVPGASTELLAINRENEYYNSKAAFESGVGPRVLHYFPDHCEMVLEFLNGTTMSKDSLNQPGMTIGMAHAIKKLHAGPRFLTDFNMFRLTEYYLHHDPRWLSRSNANCDHDRAGDVREAIDNCAV
jgi:thiamine kinase-like enzyme